MEIAERNGGADNVVLVGIVRRGATLAERIAAGIRSNGKARDTRWHSRHFVVSR